MTDATELLQRVQARAAELGVKTTTETAEPEWDPRLIPDFDDAPPPRSETDIEIDDVLERVGIVEAYERWCGKSKIGRRRTGENIKVSCPNPAHADKSPSAWLNADKGLWTCGPCGFIGGDMYDLAAIHFGYAWPDDYKTDGSFPELRKAMASDLGYVVVTSGGVESLETIAPPAEPEPQSKLEDGAEPAEPAAREQSAPPAPNLRVLPQLAIDAVIEVPPIDWHELVPSDTFLARWMRACSVDDLPEEYYFWLGLVGVGLAAGNDAVLMDRPPVRGNLFVCLNGPSGIGKSRSMHALSTLLARALPFDHEDPANVGAYLCPVPGSAEALVDFFQKTVHDEENRVIGYAPVRGFVRFNELSSLIGRANRTGSTMKPTLMEFYDGYGPIEIKSRGAGLARAEGHFASVVTTTQPGAVRDLLAQADADSGFINRWIFASGQLKPLVAYGRDPLELEPLVQPLQTLRGWARNRGNGQRLTLEGNALECWTAFFDEHLAPIRTSDDSSLLTRMDVTLKKLILLFAINEMQQPDLDIVQRVVKLYDYLRPAYLQLGKEIGLGEFEDVRSRLGDFIRSYELAHDGSPPSIRDINRGIRKMPRDVMKRVLDVMVDLGELQMIESKKARGPAVRVYKYVA